MMIKLIKRVNYDHVGIRACLYENDISGLHERVAKARHTLNAISDLGIRQNGLNIFTCCKMFWSIVVPTELFGCKLLILTNKSIFLLEELKHLRR